MQTFFSKLFSILTHHDKKFLIILVVISIVISLIEMIGVGAILPFISIASDFSTIHSNVYIEKIYTFFEFSSDIHFVIFIGMVLLGFYLVRFFLNFGYFHLLSRFSKGRYHLLAYRLFENYLGMSYRNFTHKNSADLTKAIVSEAHNMTNLISGLLLVLSEIFVVVLLYAIMLYVSWKITLFMSVLLVLNGVFFASTVSRAIEKSGISREEHQKKFYDIIQQSLGNFKMMKLSSSSGKILEKFERASSGYASANIRNESLSHFPRLFLEALGFGMIIFMIIYIIHKYQSDISGAMALISMFILGLYRLMPSANRILSGYNQILFYKSSLDIVHNDLMYDVEELGDVPVEFEHAITLENISFEYDDNKPILTEVTLTISKGDKIAFVGESGSGKSTLIDLVIGLYRSKNGRISVDNVVLNETNIKQWRSKVGYIPQSIYLFDGSVADNVAFHLPIESERVKKVLEQANILTFLEENHEGIETRVGDDGIKLSGGQRQRIAIARALYSNPEILVLDEATSALDAETEAKIMEEIYRLCEDKTLIVIAHRLSTLAGCEKIYTLKKAYVV